LFYYNTAIPHGKGEAAVSKSTMEPVTVYINRNSKMLAFIWRRRLYRIKSILCWWREPAEWWNSDPIRLMVRVTAGKNPSGIYELCQSGKDWFMHRIID
jgi:hypothetical protein